MYLETLRSRIDTHAKDTTVHVTADEKSLWNSLASLFELVDIGTEESPLMAIKAKYGLFSNSFISARGSDPEAGSGGSGGLDVQAMWYALAQPTGEQINVSHIPDLAISKITGLQDALDAKLEGITKAMVEAVLTGTVTSHNHDGRYAPLSGGLIPSQYLPSYVDDVVEYTSLTAFPATGEAGKIYVALDTNLTYRWGGSGYVEISPSLALGHTSSTAYPGDEGAANASAIQTLQGYFSGGAAKRVEHALTLSFADGAPAVYDGSAAVEVTVPTEAQMTLWDRICALFDIDADGNVYVKDNRGFYGNSFVSARGSDPEAGASGGGGLDEDALWDILGTSGAEKIDISHIPELQQLSGTLTNAQLANSSLSIAGVEVPLGGSVSTEQIASALGLGSNAYTSTAYLPLAGGTMTGHITLGGANSSSLLVQMHDDNSNYRTALGWKSAASGTLIAQIGYWNSAQKITLNPCSDEVSEIWNDAAGKYNFVVGKNWLSYNTYPILHSVNYTDYTVTKTGVGASGTWPISVSGTATYATVLSNNANTNVSQYLKYRVVSGQTSLVGSNAVNGAWCLPTTGVDAGYGNGQILRFGWAQYYYTDLHTGPNEIGSSSGLQFRQVVAGAVSSLGWRTLLDTANYATLIDSRYVKKSGDTMTGTLTFPTATNAYDSLAVRFSGVSSRIGVDAAGGLGLYAQDAIYLRPSWTSGGTSYGLIIRASDLTYNGNPLLHSGNYTNYTVTKTGGGASGAWGISISGIANRAVYLTSTYTGSGGLQPPSYFNGMGLKVNMMNKPVSYCDVIFVNGYSGQGSDVPYVNALAFQKTANAHGEVYHARADYGGSSWGTWYKFLDEYNYAGILDSRYLLKSAYTAADILAKLKTVDGSGSGLDADLLDGYQAAGLSRLLSYIDSGTKTAAGWYRVFTASSDRTNALGVNIILHLARSYNYTDNEAYTFCISVAYNNQVDITQVSGLANARLITKIRVVSVNSGALYVDFYLSTATNGNTYYVSGTGPGTFQAAAAVSALVGNVTEFTTVNGIGNSGDITATGTIRATTGIWSDGYVSAKGQDTTSDARYKRDVASLPAQAALAVLMRLRPSTWAWKDDGRRGAGFIAQEVLGVLPEAVREVGGGEDRHLALNYQMLHAYEVSALQTHETELERLRDRVLLLENEIKRIRHGS